MYTQLGFLPPNITLEKLSTDTELADLQSSSDNDEDEAILEDDTLIYAIKNTPEMSYIEFHIRSSNDDFFIHHDIYVTDTILSSAYFQFNDKHYLATAGFETSINVFDCLMYNPLEPQYVLKGHNREVNELVLVGTNLMSASDDMTIRTWDLSLCKEVNQMKRDYFVRKMQQTNDANVFVEASENTIYFESNVIYENSAEIECMKVKNYNVIISDESGFVKVLDYRRQGVIESKKVHEGAVTAFEIIGDEILSVSTDELVIWSNFGDLEQRRVINSKNELYCIKYDENRKMCLCAGKKEELKFLDI